MLHVYGNVLHVLGNVLHVLGNVLHVLSNGLQMLGNGIMSFGIMSVYKKNSSQFSNLCNDYKASDSVKKDVVNVGNFKRLIVDI